MSSSEGLSRRRVAGLARRDSADTRTASGSGENGAGGRPGARSGAGNADAGQDIDQYAPRLTLMDEVVLLGLKEKEGYLSFWNDSISYVLRGCILAELALRGRIAIVREGAAFRRENTPLAERPIEVIDGRPTGEVLLDEALRIIKSGDRASISNWINFLSGETWNITKISYQLKQVRERLAKGLVDKGVLRTEKRNFLLFDMATHPVQDTAARRAVVQKCIDLVLARAPPVADDPAPDYLLRRVVFVCAAFAANVLENALPMLEFEAREACYAKADVLIAEYGQWPMPESVTRELDQYLSRECLEAVAGVLSVYARMDSVL
ncbi:Golgi phospho protein 3-domain-containing protein [Thamnocephalis sphaerospora]|uniref:Golgi phospho protein 3-domain-containing protein n=1 Tax=Thamnocephalis sphaerospora TaxID=78915 RepID=A0A4V1IWG1_9FUNG|nr:Golgi phospho protein 3-domain-containing protein [Thamnocephalis sphaerospora]|eukprot:RKP07439.1 Golgi phospho protein 3-domain-containing protein [Thamnocephalis sphaerospora]